MPDRWLFIDTETGDLDPGNHSLAGHNVHFDANLLRSFFSRDNINFSEFFSHRIIDTSSILHYLYLAGRIKLRAVSSDEAFDLFDIKVEGRHTALGDAIATAKLYTRLLKQADSSPPNGGSE